MLFWFTVSINKLKRISNMAKGGKGSGGTRKGGKKGGKGSR
jgi:hypothetical protein